jgi:hypothetical protein
MGAQQWQCNVWGSSGIQERGERWQQESNTYNELGTAQAQQTLRSHVQEQTPTSKPLVE